MKVLTIGSCKKFICAELLSDKGGGGYFEPNFDKIGLIFAYNSAKLWLNPSYTDLKSAKGGLI